MVLALIPGLPGVGPTELIIVLTIILLLFGAKKIPELAKGLGSGVREFKKGSRGDYDEVDDEPKKEEELTAGGDAGVGEDTHNARMRAEADRTAEKAEQRSGERNL
jgi:sec-independent protein translocase protein TatA